MINNMTADAEPSQIDHGAAQEVVLAVVDGGLVRLGDRTIVDSYIARMRAVSRQSLTDLGITAQSLTELGAASSTLVAFHAEAGQYFRMSPQSLEKFRQLKVLPSADGFFKGIVRDKSGHWAGNLDLPSPSESIDLTFEGGAIECVIIG